MEIKEKVDLRKFTTFGIGGSSKYFTTIRSNKDLMNSLEFSDLKNIPYYVLAGGSNILFSDKGFSGLIVHMAIDCIDVNREYISMGAGVKLSDLVTIAKNNSLTGVERFTGIPGTIGGAVRGNVGAFGLEISDVLKSVTVYDKLNNKIKCLDITSCEYNYRTSLFKKTNNYIILEAVFYLNKGKENEINREMYKFLSERTKRHIQDIKSAGSFFVNPQVSKDVQELFYKDKGIKSKNGRVPAGWLLDSVGLSRKKIGGVQAGNTHANYFLNLGNATSSEVIQLASMAKTRVRDEFSVQLKEEVQLVGF